jgi:hypothetical protein
VGTLIGWRWRWKLFKIRNWKDCVVYRYYYLYVWVRPVVSAIQVYLSLNDHISKLINYIITWGKLYYDETSPCYFKGYNRMWFVVYMYRLRTLHMCYFHSGIYFATFHSRASNNIPQLFKTTFWKISLIFRKKFIYSKNDVLSCTSDASRVRTGAMLILKYHSTVSCSLHTYSFH